jgi:hypothetical protein
MAITTPPGLKKPIERGTGDTHFLGQDSLQQPERLAAGEMQSSLNLLWSGASLTTRAGFLGQLTTARSTPIYLCRTRYLMADGTIRLVFAAEGKLWYSVAGGTSAVEITKPGSVSFTFGSNGSGVRFEKVGRYIYFLDSTDTAGTLWRVNLQAGVVAEQISGLPAPTPAPIATLLDGSILASSVGALTWGNSTSADTDIIATADTNFQGATGFWDFREGASAANTLDANGLGCVELDADGGSRDYVTFTAAQSLPAFGSSVPSLESKTRLLAKIAFTYAATENTGSTDPEQSVRCVLAGAGANGEMRYDAQLNLTTPTARVYPASRFESVLDLRNTTGVSKIQMRLESPTADGTKGCDVNLITLKIPNSTLAVSNSSGTAVVKQGSVLAYNGTLYTDGLSAWASLASTQNWSGITSITADIVKDASVSTLSLELGAKVGSAWFWTLPVVVTDSVQTVFNLEEIRASLTSVTQFALRVVGDLSVSSLAEGGTQTLFTVANLRSPGNLTAGLTYAYRWGQSVGSDSTAATYVEGTVGKYSNLIEPSDSSRRCVVDLRGSVGTAPTLASASTFLPIYRIGSATPDGDTRDRLIAYVPVGSNLASPSGTGKDDATNKWFWDATNYLFYDNTPDSDLANAAICQEGRDVTPAGGVALMHFAGRIWIGRYDSTRQVNEVHASWALSADSDYPYFTYVSDPDDPEQSRKGQLLRIGGMGNGDRIVNFSTVNLDSQGGNKAASLVVLTQQVSPSIITGSSGGQFAVFFGAQEVGGGCLSAEGIEKGPDGVWWLGASGIMSTGGRDLARRSESIEKRFSLLALGATRYAATFLAWHNHRLWCMTPGSGSTDGEIFLWDSRAPDGGQWFSLKGASSLGFVSACSLSGGSDSGDLYLGGRDGQIYKYSASADMTARVATQDKATPAASGVNISWDLTSRRHGQLEAELEYRYSQKRPTALMLDLSYAHPSTTTTTLAWRIRNEFGVEVGAGKDITLPSGRIYRPAVTGIPDVRGLVHELYLSGSVAAPLTINSYLLRVTDLGAVR